MHVLFILSCFLLGKSLRKSPTLISLHSPITLKMLEFSKRFFLGGGKKCHFYGSSVVHSFKVAGCPSGGTTSHCLSSFRKIQDTLNTEAPIEVLVEIPI